MACGIVKLTEHCLEVIGRKAESICSMSHVSIEDARIARRHVTENHIADVELYGANGTGR